jgi:hypothetical protein
MGDGGFGGGGCGAGILGGGDGGGGETIRGSAVDVPCEYRSYSSRTSSGDARSRSRKSPCPMTRWFRRSKTWHACEGMCGLAAMSMSSCGCQSSWWHQLDARFNDSFPIKTTHLKSHGARGGLGIGGGLNGSGGEHGGANGGGSTGGEGALGGPT